jgi:Uma2 family endonuclease
MTSVLEMSGPIRVQPPRVPAADRFASTLIEILPDVEPGFLVVPRNLNWGHYRRILEARDRLRRGARVTFDRGSLEVMTVASIREQWKKLLAMLVECLAEEMGHGLVPVGNVTISRQDLDRGFEPDECYYVQNALQILPLHTLDFSRDPPPDLAIEVEYTRSVLERLPMYAAVGVPEVWRYDGETLTVLRLQSDRTYAAQESSPTFPGIPLSALSGFLTFVGTRDSASIIREFRTWVKRVLAPPSANP